MGRPLREPNVSMMYRVNAASDGH